MCSPQSVIWMRGYQADGVKKERLSHQSEVTCFAEHSLHRKLNYSQLWSPPNNNPGSAFHFTFMKKGRNWRCGLGGPMAAYLECLKHVICDLHVRGERRWGEYGVQKWQTDGEKVKSTQKKNKEKIQLLPGGNAACLIVNLSFSLMRCIVSKQIIHISTCLTGTEDCAEQD